MGRRCVLAAGNVRLRHQPWFGSRVVEGARAAAVHGALPLVWCDAREAQGNGCARAGARARHHSRRDEEDDAPPLQGEHQAVWPPPRQDHALQPVGRLRHDPRPDPGVRQFDRACGGHDEIHHAALLRLPHFHAALASGEHVQVAAQGRRPQRVALDAVALFLLRQFVQEVSGHRAGGAAAVHHQHAQIRHVASAARAPRPRHEDGWHRHPRRPLCRPTAGAGGRRDAAHLRHRPARHRQEHQALVGPPQGRARQERARRAPLPPHRAAALRLRLPQRLAAPQAARRALRPLPGDARAAQRLPRLLRPARRVRQVAAPCGRLVLPVRSRARGCFLRRASDHHFPGGAAGGRGGRAECPRAPREGAEDPRRAAGGELGAHVPAAVHHLLEPLSVRHLRSKGAVRVGDQAVAPLHRRDRPVGGAHWCPG
mmetsp:Transcript_22900/g.52859  ORF Transcript_22900/g.52859 Transcript_22900/m.52859 type:complete len:427 (+) Transcript_22900:1590-2870(+)